MTEYSRKATSRRKAYLRLENRKFPPVVGPLHSCGPGETGTSLGMWDWDITGEAQGRAKVPSSWHPGRGQWEWKKLGTRDKIHLLKAQSAISGSRPLLQPAPPAHGLFGKNSSVSSWINHLWEQLEVSTMPSHMSLWGAHSYPNYSIYPLWT